MNVAKSHIKWLMPWRVFYYLTWDLFCTYSSVPEVLYFVLVYCTSAIESLLKRYSKASLSYLSIFRCMHNVGRNIAPEPEFRFKWKRAYNSKFVYFSCFASLLTIPEDKSNFVEEGKKIYRWACISRNALGFHWLNTLSMGWGSLFFCGVKAPWGRTTIPHGYPFLKDKKRGKEKAIFFAWMVWMDGARLPGDVRRLLGGRWWWWFM